MPKVGKLSIKAILKDAGSLRDIAQEMAKISLHTLEVDPADLKKGDIVESIRCDSDGYYVTVNRMVRDNTPGQ